MLIPFVSSSALDRFGDDNGLLMLVVTCTGIIVVFLVLIILIMVFNMFGIFGKSGKKSLPQSGPKKSLDSAPSAAAVASAPIAGALPASSSGVSEEIIAVISAAVAVTLDGKPFVIRHVRRASSGGNAWSRAGILENTRPF